MNASAHHTLRARAWLLRSWWALVCLAFVQPLAAQEVCDNGIDDDGNGLVDLNDVSGCPCSLPTPISNLIQNGSFEDHTCCPQGASGGVPFQNYLDCATGWSNYMSYATCDYFNCDLVPAAMPQPVPDGSAAAGFGAFTNQSNGTSYYEVLTTCLAAPMASGQHYEFRSNVAATYVQQSTGFTTFGPIGFGPIDLAIYGQAGCPPPAPFSAGPAVLCPTELGWTEIGHVTYTPVHAWQELTVTFTAPFDVQAIAFGPACPIPADYISSSSYWPYFFVDDMSIEPVALTIQRQGHPCTDDLVLTAEPYDPVLNSYQWYLNGVAIVGQTADVLQASALGLAEGAYAVSMIQPDGSCLLAQEVVVVHYPQPLVDATPAAGCAPLNVQLTDQTDPALSGTVLWDLGDGSTANTGTVDHTYSNAGTYDVRLTVTSAQGCVKDSLFEDLITVHPTPVADFTVDTTTGCVGTQVHFTNTSTPADDYTCTWSFGDGQIEQDDCSPTHAYQDPGTYNVVLQVANAFGCQDDVIQSQLITILPTPEPSFIASPDSGCVPLSVRFNNDTPGQDQQTAFWDLGNGQTDTALNTDGTYSIPGAYTVSLTMTNQLGCSATLTRPDAVTAHGLPVVTFFVEPDTGCAPLDVLFNNTTDPGMIGGCAWAFGDGGTSDECQVMHAYTGPGTYSVSLTVTSPAGCDGDTTLYHLVHVDPSPEAHFTFGPQPTDFYHPNIVFEDRSSNDVVDWQWTFPQGDPPTSNEQHPRTSFPSDTGGFYPVQLVVTNSFGCTDTLTQVVVIDGVFSVYVPNAFTPDGDGHNDVFVPIVRDALDNGYDLRIFDRWGTEVFHAAQPHTGWDGRVNGVAPVTGVYVWKLRIRSSVDRIIHEYNGHISVLP